MGDIYRMDLVCQFGAQAGVNSLFFRSIAAVGQPISVVAIAEEMSLFWSAKYKLVVGNSARYYGARVIKVRPVGGEFFQASINGQGSGTAGTGMMSPATSGLISLFAQIPGKGGRCRKYIPFPSVVHNTEQGIPTAAYQALVFDNFGVSYINTKPITEGVNSEEFEYGHLHIPVPPEVGPPAPERWGKFYGYIVRPKWATQRRRSDFGRPNPLP